MSSLLRYAVIVFVINLAAKALTFIRDIVLVNRIGMDAGTDAFYAGLNIVEFFILFSGLNAFRSVATTSYVRHSSDDRESSKFLSIVLYVIIPYGIVGSLPLAIASGPIVTLFLPGLSPPSQLTAAFYLRILSGLVLLRGLSQILGSLLAVKKRFVLQNIFLAVTNALVLTAIAFSSQEHAIRNAAVALPLGYLLAVMFQAIFLFGRNHRLIPVDLFSLKQQVNNWFRLTYPLLFITVSLSLAGIVDKAIASYFREGTITALSFAFTLCFVPANLVLLSASNVLFPHFSSLHHEGRKADLSRVYNTGQLVLLVLFLPIVVFFICFPQDILSVFLVKKSITPSEIILTSRFLAIYSVALGANVIYYLSSFLLQSAQLNRIVGFIGMISFGMNIVGSILFSKLWGPIGIPMGTCIAYLLLAFMAGRAVRKHMGISIPTKIMKKTTYLITVALSAALLTFIITRYFPFAMDSINSMRSLLGLLYKLTIYIVLVAAGCIPVFKSEFASFRKLA